MDMSSGEIKEKGGIDLLNAVFLNQFRSDLAQT